MDIFVAFSAIFWVVLRLVKNSLILAVNIRIKMYSLRSQNFEYQSQQKRNSIYNFCFPLLFATSRFSIVCYSQLCKYSSLARVWSKKKIAQSKRKTVPGKICICMIFHSQLYRSSSFNSSGRSSACDTTDDVYSDASLEEDVLDLNHKVSSSDEVIIRGR